jgi:hypothetical protein
MDVLFLGPMPGQQRGNGFLNFSAQIADPFVAFCQFQITGQAQLNHARSSRLVLTKTCFAFVYRAPFFFFVKPVKPNDYSPAHQTPG